MKRPGERVEFALHLARIASAEIVPRFQAVAVETKNDGSEVTEADRRAEEAMREEITRVFPADGILGEEGGEESSESRYRWVLDPIDGTLFFALGVPKFGTLVALLEERQPILGVIHLPITDETLFAERGQGCWYRRPGSEPSRTAVASDVDSLSEAFISAAGVHNSEISPDSGPGPFHLTQIVRQARRFRFVGDCVQHLLVGRGLLHAALDPVMQPWDSAALVPCLLEAGGCVSTMDGNVEDVVFGGSLLTSCSPPLHATLLSMLNPDDATDA